MFGQGQRGGVFAPPLAEGVGADDWASLTAMHPDSPLVNGPGLPMEADYRYRRVAVGQPSSAPLPGAENVQGHFTELFNFRGSPMPWVLLIAIAYLGLVHLHVTGSAGLGIGRKK